MSRSASPSCTQSPKQGSTEPVDSYRQWPSWQLAALGQAVLDARAGYPDESFANLYDDVLMPGPLRKAHAAIDRYVDGLYRAAPFAGWEDRTRHLLELH